MQELRKPLNDTKTRTLVQHPKAENVIPGKCVSKIQFERGQLKPMVVLKNARPIMLPKGSSKLKELTTLNHLLGRANQKKLNLLCVQQRRKILRS